MKDKNKKPGIAHLQKAMLFRTLIPMIIMGIIICVAAVVGYENAIKQQIKDGMAGVAASVVGAYDSLYQGDYELVGDVEVSLYKGDEELTGHYEIVDAIRAATGMDVSLCYGNTRILTTLKDEYGGRAIATGINSAAFNELQESGKGTFYDNVRVSMADDNTYYVYYLPVFNDDGTFICVVGVARQAAEVEREARASLIPIIVIILASLLVATAISFGYSRSVVDAIDKICAFLKSMIGGELSNDMPSSVTARSDELGQAGKDVVEMQNAIRVLVERDALTGLYNRRYGGAKLRKLHRRAAKSGMPFSVCIGDIDFFKKVNDTYGHEAGDIVLKRVSELMNKFMVGKGFIARWGGEEFMIAFDKTDIDMSRAYLEQMLDKIRAMEILYGDLIIKITMSFGVISGSEDSDVGALLRKADARLYYGKLNGRNRVVAVDEAPQEADAQPEKKVEIVVNAADNNESDKANDMSQREEMEKSISDTQVFKELEELIKEGTGEDDTSKESEFLLKLLQKMEANHIQGESED